MTNLQLPTWARVSERRLAHIERVTSLLDQWARELGLPRDEARDWHDVGAWHDALRDADEEELRTWAGDAPWPLSVLHGPAAAGRLIHDGESRHDVLEAIRWHTLGNPSWGTTGRALFMADFLEPGRPFARAERAFLARHLPHDFDGIFRQVASARSSHATCLTTSTGSSGRLCSSGSSGPCAKASPCFRRQRRCGTGCSETAGAWRGRGLARQRGLARAARGRALSTRARGGARA